MEEIEFLYDEIYEQNKKELSQIIHLMNHPLLEKNAYTLEMFARAVLKTYSKMKRESPVVTEFDFSKYKRQEVKPIAQPKIITPAPVKQVIDYKPIIQAPVKNILPNIQKPEAHLEIEQKKEKISYPLLVENSKSIVTAEVNEEYLVHEPNLYEPDIKVIDRVKEKLGRRLNLIQDDKILSDYVKKYCSKEGVAYNDEVFSKVKYYIIRDLVQFGKIDALLHDKDVGKIICDSADKFISVDYKGKKLISNIKFSDDKEIHDFIVQLAAKAKVKLNEKEPLLDFTFENLRIFGTLGTSSAKPNFTIIKN